MTVGSETKAVADRGCSVNTEAEKSGNVGRETGTSVTGVNGTSGVTDGNGVADG